MRTHKTHSIQWIKKKKLGWFKCNNTECEQSVHCIYATRCHVLNVYSIYMYVKRIYGDFRLKYNILNWYLTFIYSVGYTIVSKALPFHDRNKFNNKIHWTLAGILHITKEISFLPINIRYVHISKWKSNKRKQQITVGCTWIGKPFMYSSFCVFFFTPSIFSRGNTHLLTIWWLDFFQSVSNLCKCVPKILRHRTYDTEDKWLFNFLNSKDKNYSISVSSAEPHSTFNPFN